METKNQITSPLRWEKKLKENGSISVEFISINEVNIIKMHLVAADYTNYLNFSFKTKKDIKTFLQVLSISNTVTNKQDSVIDLVEVLQSMIVQLKTILPDADAVFKGAFLDLNDINNIETDEIFKIANVITKHGQKMWKLLCKSKLLIVLE